MVVSKERKKQAKRRRRQNKAKRSKEVEKTEKKRSERQCRRTRGETRKRRERMQRMHLTPHRSQSFAPKLFVHAEKINFRDLNLFVVANKSRGYGRDESHQLQSKSAQAYGIGLLFAAANKHEDRKKKCFCLLSSPSAQRHHNV